MNGYSFETNLYFRYQHSAQDMTSKTKYSLISNIQSTCYGQNNHIDESER